MKTEIGRDLAEDVADGEAGVDLVELVTAEGEGFFHAGDVGVGEGGAVEIIQKVGEAAEG